MQSTKKQGRVNCQSDSTRPCSLISLRLRWNSSALGGDEFTRGGHDFGGKEFERRLIVGGEDKAADAVIEREPCQLFSPLLRWPVEQRASRLGEAPGDVEQA